LRFQKRNFARSLCFWNTITLPAPILAQATYRVCEANISRKPAANAVGFHIALRPSAQHIARAPRTRFFCGFKKQDDRCFLCFFVSFPPRGRPARHIIKTRAESPHGFYII